VITDLKKMRKEKLERGGLHPSTTALLIPPATESITLEQVRPGKCTVDVIALANFIL